MSSRKVVVVTGGAGFVGSHLIDALLEDYDVLCVDNYVTGNPENLYDAYNKAEARGTKLVCMNYDVSKEGLFNEISSVLGTQFDSRSVWAYLNFACPASPVAYQKDPIATLDTCYKGTMNAMQFAKVGARVLHASTSEVYGDPAECPQTEKYQGSVNTWGPRSCYDEGKRVAETVCREHLSIGHDVRVVRIFNTYGPRLQAEDGRVVPAFILQALRKEDPTIYGTGNQSRSFCYISDLVDGIISYLHLDKPHDYPINLGNPKEITIRDFANLIQRRVNPDWKDKTIENPPGQKQSSEFDYDKRIPRMLVEGDCLNFDTNSKSAEQHAAKRNFAGRPTKFEVHYVFPVSHRYGEVYRVYGTSSWVNQDITTFCNDEVGIEVRREDGKFVDCGTVVREYVAAYIDDPLRRCPDISRARAILNWSPKISLVEGLDRTIDFFRKTLK